jgi:hypothetical protein
VKITMADVRASKMCAKGARKFFARHNLDWSKFLREGIDVSEIEAINDSMAMRVVDHVRRK